MFNWVAVALAVLALAVVLRWAMSRVDALGRVRRFPVVTVAVLTTLAVAAATPGYFRHQLEQRLSKVASTVTGFRVEVDCQTFGQEFVDTGSELGYVKYGADGVPERRTLIKRQACRDLSAYLRSDKAGPNLNQVTAVHVLTHEAMHMSGEKDEAVAECKAMQRDAWTARLLGASRAEGERLARAYWRRIYPRMSQTYRSDACADGKPLDENMEGAPWGSP